MRDDETFFITGFPGFIANRLLERLAQTKARFILLVQPAFRGLAESKLKETADANGRSMSDFQLVEGDITVPELGLAARDKELVHDQSTRSFHLAALYDLAVPHDLALKVNVNGTHNVNSFVRTLPHLRHHHHVSTCYVAGKRTGRILETELEHDAGFRNHYEESKYLSELEVELLKGVLPVTIHRPSVVCGDSTTGETVKYDGVYYLILYLMRWGALSLVNIGNHEVALNLVPVDFVVDAMAALAFDDRAIGKTVQLADPEPVSTNELFNIIAKSVSDKRSRVTAPTKWVEFVLMLPPSPRITGLPHHAVPYFFLKQTYDTSISESLLNPHNIKAPSFQSYVENIVRFVETHKLLGA